MARVVVRRRRDGVRQIQPTLAPLTPGERWATMFTLLIATAGLFVSAAMPPQVFLFWLACCALSEVAAQAPALTALRRPVAEVVDLPRARRAVR